MTHVPAPLLTVKDLKTHFFTQAGTVRAVDGVSFDIYPGETLGLVGESGSGKSVTSLSIMGLVPAPGQTVGGSIYYKDEDLTRISKTRWGTIRGNEIAMIFQEPMTSLNPVYTIGRQITETIVCHQKLSRKAAQRLAVELLDQVGIPDPEKRAKHYPHQFSGGMRQRVMIAMALSCAPILLIADEPTTALDVTIQAQILDLMRTLQRTTGMSILFITHDLGIVAELADRVVIMYAGQVVEAGTVRDVYQNPRMPYTQGLIRSIPRLDDASGSQNRLQAIPGYPPKPLDRPSGCAFHPRCPHAVALCTTEVPILENLEGHHQVHCCRWHLASHEVQV